MEISNLTLGKKDWKIFQQKLLLPWVRDVQKQKEKRKKDRKKKNQSIKIEERKIEKKKRGFFEPDYG